MQVYVLVEEYHDYDQHAAYDTPVGVYSSLAAAQQASKRTDWEHEPDGYRTEERLRDGSPVPLGDYVPLDRVAYRIQEFPLDAEIGDAD